jgi:polyketide biosynthesis acyl carrier protein
MNTQEIFKTVCDNAREVLPDLRDHDFKFDDRLKDLGANSIDRSEILMMTLESLGLQIPLIQVASAENVGELSEILHEKLTAN